MTEKEVIRKVMSMRDWSQPRLAEEAGFKSQSNITGLLNNNKNGIRIDNLVRIFNAMGCEVVVRDKMGSKQEWVIDMVQEAKYPMKEMDLDSLLSDPEPEPPKRSGKGIKLTK